MWTIPEVYTRIPQVNISDYHWYVISFQTFKKLKQIDDILLDYDRENFMWIPVHDEYKRLQSSSNQVVTIDKPNYPNYGFLAIKPDTTNIKELRSKINTVFYATILEGSVFHHEVKTAFEVAYKLSSKKKKPTFEVGTYVLIVSGAFYGMRAKVINIDKTKVYLEVSMGQNSVQIVTNILDVVKDSDCTE